jgi:hypothetical protein
MLNSNQAFLSVFFFGTNNSQISPKNLNQPPVGLDFNGEIRVFSPKNVVKP